MCSASARLTRVCCRKSPSSAATFITVIRPHRADDVEPGAGEMIVVGPHGGGTLEIPVGDGDVVVHVRDGGLPGMPLLLGAEVRDRFGVGVGGWPVED